MCALRSSCHPFDLAAWVLVVAKAAVGVDAAVKVAVTAAGEAVAKQEVGRVVAATAGAQIALCRYKSDKGCTCRYC